MEKSKKITNISFKLVKELITKCDLDPYYKGKLLSAINKVSRMKDCLFKNNTPTINLSHLINWQTANVLKEGDNYKFWLIIDCYLSEIARSDYNSNTSLFKEQLINILDNSKL